MAPSYLFFHLRDTLTLLIQPPLQAPSVSTSSAPQSTPLGPPPTLHPHPQLPCLSACPTITQPYICLSFAGEKQQQQNQPTAQMAPLSIPDGPLHLACSLQSSLPPPHLPRPLRGCDASWSSCLPGRNRSSPTGPPSTSCRLTHTPPATPAALSSFLPGTREEVVSVGLLSGANPTTFGGCTICPFVLGHLTPWGCELFRRGSSDHGATAECCVTLGRFLLSALRITRVPFPRDHGKGSGS